MKLRKLVIVAALFLAATSVHAGVTGTGFDPPDGARSGCGSPRCVPDPITGQFLINKSVHVTEQSPFSQMEARYGKPAPGMTIDTSPGNGSRHSTDTLEDLEHICRDNPGWFAAHGYGAVPAGTDCHATWQERWDSYFTAYPGGAGAAAFCESKRLYGIDISKDPGCNGGVASGGVTFNCGNGILELGETCAKCPASKRVGAELAISCPAEPPAPPPSQPPATTPPPLPCPVCPAPPRPPVVVEIPQWIRDQCAREKPPASKPAKLKAWRDRCEGVSVSPGYVVKIPSNAQLELVLTHGRPARG